MINVNGKYGISFEWIGTAQPFGVFNTKQEALEYVKNHDILAEYEQFTGYFESDDIRFVYVGRIRQEIPKLDTETILNKVYKDVNAVTNDLSQDYLLDVNARQEDELDYELNRVFNKWLETNDLYPDYFELIEIETIELSQLPLYR